MNEFRLFKVILFIIIVSVVLIEGRGGRGRGGGSFGSLFGGWRKYKKPASSSSSRRIINGSPMHTSMTKQGSSMSSSPVKQPAKASQIHSSYPKQQMPSKSYASQGYKPLGGYYAPGGPGAAHLPPGSTYYTNTASIPQGAIYYAQPYSSSGSTSFLQGYLTGHLLSSMMLPRHHVSQIYHQQTPSETPSSQGSKVIIINNGEVLNANKTETSMPPGTNVPLSPLNETIFTEENIKPETKTVPSLEFPSKSGASAPDTPPPHGIICMPMTLNETDPNDSQKIIHVVRIVCFPAPPPPEDPPTTTSPTSKDNCVSGFFIETDPNDPTKTIEVHKEECMNTTSVPKEIVGEITDVSDNP